MPQPKRHHFVPSFLLRSFATPASDEGFLFVLDSKRKKVFPSRPSMCGFRSNYNRLDPTANPNPNAIEEYYGKIESNTAPIIQNILEGNSLESLSDREWILAFISLQFVRTPRFRRWLEGQHFRMLELEFIKYTRNKPARRRFAKRQREAGLPEKCWSPEGYIEQLKSGDFEITTDDNWKMGVSNEAMQVMTNVLSHRNWYSFKYEDDDEALVLADAPVGLQAVGKEGGQVVGLGRHDTIVYLPIGPHHVVVGVFQEEDYALTERLSPLVLNSTSYACSLEQCFSTTDDFRINDPDRGPTQWSSYLQEGKFPKLFFDIGELADEYAGSASD